MHGQSTPRYGTRYRKRLGLFCFHVPVGLTLVKRLPELSRQEPFLVYGFKVDTCNNVRSSELLKKTTKMPPTILVGLTRRIKQRTPIHVHTYTNTQTTGAPE